MLFARREPWSTRSNTNIRESRLKEGKPERNKKYFDQLIETRVSSDDLGLIKQKASEKAEKGEKEEDIYLNFALDTSYNLSIGSKAHAAMNAGNGVNNTLLKGFYSYTTRDLVFYPAEILDNPSLLNDFNHEEIRALEAVVTGRVITFVDSLSEKSK